MKKVLMFICSLLMVSVSYIVFSDVVGAVEPSDPEINKVYKYLKLVASNLSYQVRHDALADMEKLDERYSLDKKPFCQVCEEYDKALKESLSNPENPIALNCFAFASFAYRRFLEHTVPVKYLRIYFEKEYKSASGVVGKLGHNVVLVPQREKDATRYYICDFYLAMAKHKVDDYLFVPFETYLNKINNDNDNGRIEEMMVIPNDDSSFFKPFKCEDLRMWFLAFAKDEGMAKAIVELERKNQLMMHLRIGRHWASDQSDYTLILTNLYNMVNPAMALRYATHPLVYIWD